MNKYLFLATVVAVTGAVSHLGLQGSSDPTSAPRTSAPLRSHDQKARTLPLQAQTRIPASESRFLRPMAVSAEAAGVGSPAGEATSVQADERPVEIPGELVPEELEWPEAVVEEKAGADAMDWEDPYGGNWHDRGGA